MKTLMTAVAGAALIVAAPAAATTIVDFESTPTGYTANPLTIGDATFSGPGGLFVFPYDSQQICSTVDATTCSGSLTVSFAAAISGLSFTAFGDNSASNLAVLLNFVGGSSTLANFVMDGDLASDLVDLSAYSNILSFLLTTDDVDGLTYDNFSYDVAAAVPEPASWAMMLLGFGAIGGALRYGRRRRALSLSHA